MKINLTTLVVAIMAGTLLTGDAFARGGRGGGGGGGHSLGGGGGISRPGGGGHTPSMSRPSVSRPSMPTSRPSLGGGGSSRPSIQAPSINRPTSSRPTISRPSTGSRPNISLPSTGGSSRPSFNRPDTGSRPSITIPGSGNSGNRPGITVPGSGGGSGSRPGITRPGTGDRPSFTRPGGGDSSFSRPSRDDLQDFLNLPGRPSGGDRPSITIPGGGNTGGTRPGTGDRPGIIDRPGTGDRPGIGDRPGSGDRPGTGDRFPNRPGNGGDGDRPGNGDRFPNRPGGDRPNIGNGNNNNINIGNKVTIDRDKNINNIRNKWNNVNIDRPGNRHWWDGGRYPNNPNWRWHTGWNRYPPHWCWRPAAWGAFGGWFVWNAWTQPVIYDYGSNVVYRDNYVYVNDQQYATADQYYNQAVTIADSIPQNVDDQKVEWMPLGVFAIADESGTDSGMVMQLAVSKEGIIAGTFYNDVTKSDRPLEGMVDQKTQRAAWKFADDKDQDIVMETSIYNLTQDEATALVHYGESDTQTWTLVRLEEPKDDEAAAPAGTNF
ncbi:hypothetical protein [Bremerella cremea]|uniref:hypothetical protein n=1 Tax=Bremerella cremea TaxID=1031537 RepID=UPI0031EA0546